ncbi:MAG: choice-of-anchor D domain-containing protein, partial [Anaerolineales bacterium]|nr:choice-of-anchor D domain-containing protein [Anaerolineales bacterium]
DYIAYESYAGGDADIWIYSISLDVAGQATIDPAEQYLHDLSGNRLVYTDNRNDNLDIYMFEFLAFAATPALLVGSNFTDSILRYDRSTGEFIDTFVSGGSGELNAPWQAVFGPNHNLYVSSSLTDSILRYNGQSGEFIDAFVSVKSGGLATPHGLVFGPDGNLYVSSANTDSILRYNGTTGEFIDAFASGNGLDAPCGLSFGPEGNLYVSSYFTDSILRYNGQTGVFVDPFVPAGSGGLDEPHGLVFGPDGNLYVSSANTDSILRYNGQTGASMGNFASQNGLDRPIGLVFGPDGNLYVSSYFTDSILRYNGQTGVFIDAFVHAESGGLDGPMWPIFKVSDIEVSPQSVEFGQVEIGTSTSAIVSISNIGDAGLTVSDILLVPQDGDFFITSVPSTPVILSPGATVDVEIAFTPSATGSFSCTLKIISSDP